LRTRLTIAILGVLFVASDVRAQQTGSREVIIDHADSLVARVLDGDRVQSLVGNVRVRQGETHLRSNRATRFLDRGEILLSGRVEIVERGDSLRADTVVYSTRSKVGHARGNVWLTDGEVVVLAPSARYDTDAKYAIFQEGVTLVDSLTTLQSLVGEYWSDFRRAEFAGDVRLDDDRSVLRADSITYHRDEERSLARGDVEIVHFEGDLYGSDGVRTHLFGATAYDDKRAGLSRLLGDPLIVQVRNDSTGVPADTLVMRAVEMVSARSDTLDRVVGTGRVSIWQSRMSASGDSLVYERWSLEEDEVESEEARMFGSPIAWMDDMQLSGDSLRVTSRGGAVDSLFVRSNSFVAQWDSVLSVINQIKGRDLTALFHDDTLRTMRTGPQAHALYHLKDDDDAIRGGIRATGDEITFEFEGGELSRVAIVSGTEGEYFPGDLLPEPFALDGLDWRPGLRPDKAQLLGDRMLEFERPTARLDDSHTLNDR
jgi:lipopolysaccharide export system protein LptA